MTVQTSKIFYAVSDSPDRLELAGEETLTQYQTPEEAGDGIKNGWHGEYGTKYVLPVTVGPVAATYDRPWALIKKEPES